jgi:predicted methyltransferase
MAYGEYEPHELTTFRSIVKPGDVVADVGANVGYLTAHMADLVGPEGRVHAFEPSLTPLQYLRKVSESCP